MPDTEWTADDIDLEDLSDEVVVTLVATGEQYHIGKAEFDAECQRAAQALAEGGSDIRWEVAAKMAYRIARQGAAPAMTEPPLGDSAPVKPLPLPEKSAG